MDQPKLERLLHLMMLLTSNTYYTVDELAKRMDTSSRSIYRYLDTFKSAGFAIYKENQYIRMGKESPFFKDISQLIHFSKEEAYMISQVIEAIDNSNVIKQNLKKKLASVYDYKIIAESVIKGKNADNIRRLIDACEQKKQVILHNYSSAHGQTITNRLVEPFAFTTNYVEVWCYEPESKRNKLFKVSRIESTEISPANWEYEHLHQEGFTDVFRMSSYEGHRYPIKLLLNQRAYSLLIEEYPLAERDTRQISDEQWLLETPVSNYIGVARFVLGLAADIQIIDSPDLQTYIKNYVEKHINPLFSE